MADKNEEASGGDIGALLTKKQRDWLADGAPDPDSSAHRSLRQRIRKRLLQSFYDFSLIVQYLPDGDVEKAFQSHRATQSHARGMISALELIYDVSRDGIWGEGTTSFEPMLKRAIRSVEYDPDDRSPHALAVDVFFEHDEIVVNKPLVSDFDLAEIGEKIANNEMDDLSRADLAWFISFYKSEGALDPQYPDRVRTRRTDPIGETLPTEESEERREQTMEEVFEDREKVEEQRKAAEETAQQKTLSDDTDETGDE